MSKKRFVSTLIIVIMLSAVFIYIRKMNEKRGPVENHLNIGIATWAGFATGMVGNEKHLFHGISLKYRIIDDQPARYAAFQNGDIDILIASVDEFAQSSPHLRGKIFLITDLSYGGDGIIAKNNIKTIADLKGKKIAFARATPSHYLLYKVLEKNGLSISDIQQIKVDDPSQAAQAFLGGSVDAAVTWEPFLSEIADKGHGHILITTRDYPGIIVDVLVASEKLLQDPALVRRFLEGWLQSVNYIKEHPEESMKIMAKGLNVSTKDIQGMMSGLKLADRAVNVEYFKNHGHGNSKLAGMLIEAGKFWKSQGIISDTMPVKDLISKTAVNFFDR